MGWIESAEEYREADEEAKARAAYTWKHATMDLTYSTRLTLMEAGRVIEEFRRANVHPYDALPLMVKVINSGFNCSDFPSLAKAVVDLIRLERTLDEGNKGS